MNIGAAVMRDGRGPFSIESLELGAPRADEALVRIVGCGICHTDLLGRSLPPGCTGVGPRGPTGGACVFGHEGSGVVEAVGSGVSYVAVGDHVVLSFTNCRSCPACKKGRPGVVLIPIPPCPSLAQPSPAPLRPTSPHSIPPNPTLTPFSHHYTPTPSLTTNQPTASISRRTT